MKKIKSINKIVGRLLCISTVTMLFSSCESFLDREPLDQVSQATFWKTPEQLDAYIMGKYSWLPEWHPNSN